MYKITFTNPEGESFDCENIYEIRVGDSEEELMTIPDEIIPTRICDGCMFHLIGKDLNMIFGFNGDAFIEKMND